MKTNELAIRKQEIDWLKIINLAFNKSGWGKKYVLYTCQSATIYCSMKEFNFEEEIAWFKLTIEYVHNDYKNVKCDLIKYYLKNFTVDDFKMHLSKKLVSMLNNTIYYKKKSIAELKWNHLEHCSWRIDVEQILDSQYAEDYDSIKEIKSEELREQCTEELKDLLCEDLNEDFNAKVDREMKRMSFNIVGVTEILKSLEGKK